MTIYVIDCTKATGYSFVTRSGLLADIVARTLSLVTGRFHDTTTSPQDVNQ